MEEEEKSSGSRSSWDKPEGRIKRCAKLRLLKTNEPLFIPFTQEPAPMTEDRLEEHAGVLLRLGTDAMGSQLRARMMSASLLSDMESFKVIMVAEITFTSTPYTVVSCDSNLIGSFWAFKLRMFKLGREAIYTIEINVEKIIYSNPPNPFFIYFSFFFNIFMGVCGQITQILSNINILSTRYCQHT